MTSSHNAHPDLIGAVSQERPGFLSQKYMESLAVTFDNEEVSLFLNPHFFTTLKKQFIDSFQPEPVKFLRDIFNINQRDLTPDQLDAEVTGLFTKYLNHPDDPNYLNVGSACLDMCNQEKANGAQLLSLVPAISEAIKLIKTNMSRPIGALSQKEVKKQLADAHIKDKEARAFFLLMLPTRSVICSALDGVCTALNNLETKEQPLSDKEKDRADALVAYSIEQMQRMRFSLQQVLRKTMEMDAPPLKAQEETTDILNEYFSLLQKSKKVLDGKFGAPNTRSTVIETLLAPVTAAKVWHETLTSKPRTNRQGDLQRSSSSLCYSESNMIRVSDYMEKVKDIDISKPLPKQASVLEVTLSELGLRKR